MSIHILNKKTYSPALFPVFIEPHRIFYVGRPSILGNPFYHERAVPSWSSNDGAVPVFHTTVKVATREEAVQAFREHLHVCEAAYNGANMELREALIAVWEKIREIAALVAKDPGQEWGLMCWCAPEACHADIIKKAIGYVLRGIQQGKED